MKKDFNAPKMRISNFDAAAKVLAASEPVATSNYKAYQNYTSSYQTSVSVIAGAVSDGELKGIHSDSQ